MSSNKRVTAIARRFAVVCMIFLFAACSKPTINTSSDEEMKASVAQVRESLPENKRNQFDKALQLVALSKLDFSGLIADGATGAETSVAKMKSGLGGKTGEQIIAEAQAIEGERKVKEREQAMAEIKELQQKKVTSELAKRQLAKFKVVRSRFYKQKGALMDEQPIIELTVRNETSHAISRAYFVGTLASPGRSVPWIKDSFNYQIPGGLEAGEQATWSLAPNMFSDWGKITAPPASILTVEIVKLDGAGGNTLFSTDDFTDNDAQRLKELLLQYPLSARAD